MKIYHFVYNEGDAIIYGFGFPLLVSLCSKIVISPSFKTHLCFPIDYIGSERSSWQKKKKTDLINGTLTKTQRKLLYLK